MAGIDWNRHLTDLLEIGGAAAETRANRVVKGALVQAGLIAFFLIVVWRLLK